MKWLSVVLFSALMVFSVACDTFTANSELIESKSFKDIPSYKDMVVERRLEAAPECGGGKREVLLIHGGTPPEAGKKIAGMVKSLPECPMRKVYMRSDGGSSRGAISLGKLFKEYNVHTIIPENGRCGLICAHAFIGGRERSMEGNSRLVFELPCYYATGSGIQKKCQKSAVKLLSDHIIDMLGYNAQSKAIIEKGLGVRREWVLAESKARSYGLVTD